MSKRLDLVGKIFGKLTVIKYLGKSKWLCKCICNDFVEVRADVLTRSLKTSCGCDSVKKINLNGKAFGRLIVIKLDHKNENGTYWLCKCECGNEKVIKGTSLLNKDKGTKSCGCLTKETCSKNLPAHRNASHRMSKTNFYGVWNTMVMRCTNPNSKSYERYGVKGILVCERWRAFQNFYDDMFLTYKKGLSIDRINGSKGYYFENCRWVDSKVQANNTKSNHILKYKGISYTLSQASENFNIPYDTLKRRIYKGWSISEAIETTVINKVGETDDH
ncbi:hypothetical protein [Clostridium gasigenes]|uniref:hypothetical protein n=1 Tax=Clostridium gasigenes TaxID=94869 RepID=UPI001C0B5876|nr:hypothetical protein [Clostridium gasigenes]MBU3102951.1 hypothetical protein [Clostridium gasigenes]